MSYSTDDVAKAARTTLRAVRLWDSQGLFGEVPRGENGERVFSVKHLQKAWAIGVMQMDGKSLPEIRAIMQNPNWHDHAGEAVVSVRDYLASIPGTFDL